MNLNDDHSSLYDVLELTPDATPQEIRSAYLRLKSAYNKDNIAHYTLFSREETERMLHSIEQAYLVLSNPEARRSYDQSQGHITAPNMTALHAQDRIFGSGTPTPVVVPEAGPATYVNTETAVSDVEALIQSEQEWGGASIKRIREARRMTLDDLCDYTRISKTYLVALEEEDFKKLPAPVYVRGFLQQVGKRLKVPVDTLVTKYLERLKTARPG